MIHILNEVSEYAYSRDYFISCTAIPCTLGNEEEALGKRKIQQYIYHSTFVFLLKDFI
jgi:hypothetical protein